MKVVFVTARDYGGAGNAVFDNHLMLQSHGVESKVLVRHKMRNDPSIIQLKESIIAKVLNKFLKIAKRFFFIDEYLFFDVFCIKPRNRERWLDKHIDSDTDVIVLGWLSTFVTISDFVRIQKRTGAKVYIQAVDMALLTGGCHYSYGCDGYTKECFICPAVTNSIGQQLIKKRFSEDCKAISDMRVRIFAPVEYVLNQAKESSKPFYSYRLTFHDFGLNSLCYKTRSQKSKTIFLGAYNPLDARKGYLTFSNAMFSLNEKLIACGEKVNILVPDGIEFSELKHSNIELLTYPFARNIQELALLYQRSDVFVSTSIDDTGPAMIIESLMCGVPVVSTETGVAAELIGSNKNLGTVVPVQDSEKLALAIYEILFTEESGISPSPEIEKYTKNFYMDRPSLYDVLIEDVNEH